MGRRSPLEVSGTLTYTPQQVGFSLGKDGPAMPIKVSGKLTYTPQQVGFSLGKRNGPAKPIGEQHSHQTSGKGVVLVRVRFLLHELDLSNTLQASCIY